MMHVLRKLAAGKLLATALFLCVNTATAQEYTPVEVPALKESPQRYWAKGIVFRDSLKEAPGRKTMKIDGREVTRFYVEDLGAVYAEAEAIEPLAGLEVGKDYFFSGTVGQRGRTYYVIVRDVTEYEEDAQSIPEALQAIRLEGSTNEYNMILEVLGTVIKDAQKDLFAYGTAHDMEISDFFRPGGENRDKVTDSVRKAIRRLEDRAKMPAQEFLVSLIISLMALQHGYAEPAPPAYVPDEPVAQDVLPVDVMEPEMQSNMTREAWDLSDPAEGGSEEGAPMLEEIESTDPVMDEQAVPSEPAVDVSEPAMEDESPSSLEEQPEAPEGDALMDEQAMAEETAAVAEKEMPVPDDEVSVPMEEPASVEESVATASGVDVVETTVVPALETAVEAEPIEEIQAEEIVEPVEMTDVAAEVAPIIENVEESSPIIEDVVDMPVEPDAADDAATPPDTGIIDESVEVINADDAFWGVKPPQPVATVETMDWDEDPVPELTEDEKALMAEIEAIPEVGAVPAEEMDTMTEAMEFPVTEEDDTAVEPPSAGESENLDQPVKSEKKKKTRKKKSEDLPSALQEEIDYGNPMPLR